MIGNSILFSIMVEQVVNIRYYNILGKVYDGFKITLQYYAREMIRVCWRDSRIVNQWLILVIRIFLSETINGSTKLKVNIICLDFTCVFLLSFTRNQNGLKN